MVDSAVLTQKTLTSLTRSPIMSGSSERIASPRCANAEDGMLILSPNVVRPPTPSTDTARRAENDIAPAHEPCGNSGRWQIHKQTK